MKDSFFVPAVAKRKRTAAPLPTLSKQNTQKRAEAEDDFEEDDVEFTVGDVDQMDLEHHPITNELSDQSDNEESAQEKRVRLAKEYIEKLKQKTRVDASAGEFDAADLDRELVESRLIREAQDLKGFRFRPYADKLALYFKSQSVAVRVVKCGSGSGGHWKSVTCVAVSPCEKFLYSGAKDGSIVQWDIETGKKLQHFPKQQKQRKHKNKKLNNRNDDEIISGHSDCITCLAVSPSGEYLASGARDSRICIWSISPQLQQQQQSPQLIKCFTQHKDTITGLAFKQGTSTSSLYSASDDRSVKVFNIDEMAYVETLFGHQDKITNLDSMGGRERCLTTGGRDRTVRMWKIVEESQLVFRASSSGRIIKSSIPRQYDGDEGDLEVVLAKDETGSVDCVAYCNDEFWVTGSDGGSIAVWTSQRKKPKFIIPNAHGRSCIIQLTSQMGGELEKMASTEGNAQCYLPNIYAESSLHLNIDRKNVGVISDILKSNPDKYELTSSSANWITAISALPNSNVVASGSYDGFIRIWKLYSSHEEGDNDNDEGDDDRGDDDGREGELKEIAAIPVVGYVTSIKFTQNGRYLVAAIGQEPRDGRWAKIQSAKNSVITIKLPGVTLLQ